MPTQENMPTVPDPDVEEVRLAMALNGGVSLAIWMGGCAVELDCARRAHWGPEDLARNPVGDGKSKRTVYNSLCEAFRRELVIDIMCGASAGGVNGGLLAASMVSRRRLHPTYVRRQWLGLGDFSKLLHPSTTAKPHSLMQGKLFTEKLMEVFKVLCGPEVDAAEEGLVLPPGQGAKSIPHLDVTVTDVRGTERSYRDAWGETFSGREYRRRYRFREESDFTPRNLAAAARSSASFPAAFEPFRAATESWQLTDPPGADPSTEPPPWTIDGGLLDNAPIRAAIELIPTRAAIRQVKRYLVYVNPEPHESLEPGAAEVGTNADGETPSDEPQLPNVVGYVVNLPRKTPFVDQLEAIEDAVQKSSLISDGTLPLLNAPIDVVAETAEASLQPYASRRRLKSLRDLLGDSAAAAQAYEALQDAKVDLPWIPRKIEFDEPIRWDWGLSTAIRFCHLLLDLIRLGIAGQNKQRRAAFLAARVGIDQQLAQLQAAYAAALDNRELKRQLQSPELPLRPAERVAELQGLAGDDQAVALSTVRASIRVFADLLKALDGELTLRYPAHGEDEEVEIDVGAALLGIGWEKDAAFRAFQRTGKEEAGGAELTGPERHCLRRALSIEVIRRAFSAEEPVDSAQELSFVQLTPDAASPIFSFKPFSNPYPASAESKLAGIRLGHFAGFLKRSWRANDFMWGRLDAAARMVDVLVDPQRVPAVGGSKRLAGKLADALIPESSTREQRWLVSEALTDLRHKKAPEQVSKLRTELADELAQDLADPSSDAKFTRTIFTRAAQLEIVRAELPAIATASRLDAEEGSASPPLDFGKADEQTGELKGEALENAICDVRQNRLLPLRLGRDNPAETTSDLTARTAAQAGFVSVAALRTAKLPGARVLDGLRPPLLAVTGMSSRSRWLKIPLVFGFWAAAAYLTARAVETDATATADLGSILARPVLLALVAVLVVLGVALLPFVRGLRTKSAPPALAEFVAAAAIILAGGGVAIGLALWKGGLSPAQLIIAQGFDPPPQKVMGLALALVLALPLTHKFLPHRILDLTKRTAVSAVLLAAVAVWISLTTVPALIDAIDLPALSDVLDDGLSWQTVAALVALILPPIVCVIYLFCHDRIQRWAWKASATPDANAEPGDATGS
jgi:predicted acylesterase/phospholipase RssA